VYSAPVVYRPPVVYRAPHYWPRKVVVAAPVVPAPRVVVPYGGY
jgi:hypothetical protein